MRVPVRGVWNKQEMMAFFDGVLHKDGATYQKSVADYWFHTCLDASCQVWAHLEECSYMNSSLEKKWRFTFDPRWPTSCPSHKIFTIGFSAPIALFYESCEFQVPALKFPKSSPIQGCFLDHSRGRWWVSVRDPFLTCQKYRIFHRTGRFDVMNYEFS